jgi:hypothetical protein
MAVTALKFETVPEAGETASQLPPLEVEPAAVNVTGAVLVKVTLWTSGVLPTAV